jgi:LDH2 family malate/lactate/ureidoglycolate dehydrogenase
VRTAEFDADHLERLMVAAFELLGKPEVEAQELAKAILKAAEWPQSGDQRPPDRDPTRRLG